MQKIIISKLSKGTRVLLEAKDGCYELLVTKPAGSIVQITVPRLGPANACGQMLDDIQQGEKFTVRFKNGTRVSGPVLSATVYGDGWHYDIF